MFMPPYGGVNFPYKTNLNWIIFQIMELKQKTGNLEQAWADFQIKFESELDQTVKDQLTVWLNDGTLESLIDNLTNKLVWVSVKDYGATGDGTTDDTQSITNAIQAASSNTKSIVFFPPGKYRITANINVPKNTQLIGIQPGYYDTSMSDSGTWLFIENPDTTASTGVNSCGTFRLYGGCKVSGFGVYYPLQSAPNIGKFTAYSPAFQIRTAGYIEISNITSVNPYTLILANAETGGYYIHDIRGYAYKTLVHIIRNTEIINIENITMNTSILVQYGFELSTEATNNLRNTVTCVLVRGSDWSRFEKIFAYNVNSAITLQSFLDGTGTNRTTRHVEIIGCGCGNTNTGININGLPNSNFQTNNILINGCDLYAVQYGIYGGDADGVKIIGNSFRGTGRAINLSTMKSTIISNNEMFNLVFDAEQIVINGENTVITNNIITSERTPGIYVNGNSSHNVTIIGNVINNGSNVSSIRNGGSPIPIGVVTLNSYSGSLGVTIASGVNENNFKITT